ncbi:cullin-3 [Aphelenchoides avenae]|nr:cullin-3 [Aphelenchus avenae]
MTADSPVLSETEVQKRLATLELAVKCILKQQPMTTGLEELYRYCYELVLNKKGDLAYNGLEKWLTEFLRTDVRKSLEQADDDRFLRTLTRSWADFNTSVPDLTVVFMYIDQVYAKEALLETTSEMSGRLFKEETVEQPAIRKRLNEILRRQISKGHQRSVAEWMELKNVCQMLLDFDVEDPAYKQVVDDYNNHFITKLSDGERLELEKDIDVAMKAHPGADPNDIIVEVYDKLKTQFIPDPNLIRSRVESRILQQRSPRPPKRFDGAQPDQKEERAGTKRKCCVIL